MTQKVRLVLDLENKGVFGLLRLLSGHTQADLAKRMKVSPITVIRAEGGDCTDRTAWATLGVFGIGGDQDDREAAADALVGGNRIRVKAIEFEVIPNDRERKDDGD